MKSSSFKKLSTLPSVFSLTEMCRLQSLDKIAAYDILNDLKKKEYVTMAGPRSGIYYNRIVSKEITAEMKLSAILRKYPTAVLIGESVLHNAEWTTQIPRMMSVAVLSKPSFTQIDGVCLYPRPKRWYKKFQNFRLTPEDADFTTHGLPAISPEYALLDLYQDKSPATWKPDVDDLDLDDEKLQKLSMLSEGDRVSLPKELQNMLDDFSENKQLENIPNSRSSLSAIEKKKDNISQTKSAKLF